MRHYLALAAVALLTANAAAYKLSFLSSIQVGQWDEDSAENVAFDPKTKRAFIASAEETGLKVVDLSNPAMPKRAGTIAVGEVMKAQCEEQDCFYENFDFGGGSAPCGYAPMEHIIFNTGDCSACASSGTCSYADCVYNRNPSYNRGTLEVDPDVGTWEGCQKRCQQDSNCEFFSWENEVWPSGDPAKFSATFDSDIKMHRAARCFLKSGFSGMTRDGTEECACETRECDGFVHWEAHKEPTQRATHCTGLVEATCNFDGATWSSGDCKIVMGADRDCVAAGGTPKSSDWLGGPRYAYGSNAGEHGTHVNDRDWYAGSGPKYCSNFPAESVQSVAITHVPGYDNAIVAAAAPHTKTFAHGMLAFFDAVTFQFIQCAPAGNKPEGIASDEQGQIACINEGSSDDEGILDNPGSMTMCEATASGGTSVSIDCKDYPIEKKHFKSGAWKHSPEFRQAGVRLYGPNGNNVTYDLEPEGGAFTDDGKYFLTVMQDNNAYAVFDVAAKKYTVLAGLPLLDNAPIDASDKDDMINIHETSSKKILMPDQVTSFMKDGKYYFITANEGGTRDEGMIGQSDPFEGEEVRMGDLPCTSSSVCNDEEMGRVLTTGYMPSDYAVNACGMNHCDADQLAGGMDGAGAGIRHGVKGAGAFKCIYRDADYGGCGSVCNLHGDDHHMWHDPSGCSSYPDTVGFYADTFAPNSYDSNGLSVSSWMSIGTDVNGNAASGAQPQLREAVDSPNPLGYDSAVECQKLCDNVAECDYFYSEYQEDYFKCYLKKAFTEDDCHEFSFKTDKYDFATRYFHTDYTGSAKFVAEGYANWGGVRSSKCVSPAPYSTSPLAVSAGPGTPGGSFTIGGRSFTIMEFNPSTNALTAVFDSGDIMETKQAMVAGGLCDGCKGTQNAPNNNGDACEDYCPFNADDAPPNFDARSDAKGPEPECTTTGVMSDGTRLAFVGLERTGGIVTYDVSDPTAPVYQDYFNVRNWMTDFVGQGDPADSDLLTYALNDGPESLVFISKDDSPIGRELLLAATPLAGRLTTYVIEDGAERVDDGSCHKAEGCPYLPASVGGEGSLLDQDVCKYAKANKAELGCDTGSDSLNTGAIAGIAVAAGVAVMALAGVGMLVHRERKGEPMFSPIGGAQA